MLGYLENYKLLAHQSSTTLLIELAVSLAVMSPAAVKSPMRKRCLDTINSDSKELYKDGQLVNFEEVLNNIDIFDSEYKNADCGANCTSGYLWSSPPAFDDDFITMEYTLNLTECNSQTHLTRATSFVFIGMAIGPYVFGYVADKYGRKLSLLSSGYLLALTRFKFCSKPPFPATPQIFEILNYHQKLS